ncbi:uncharacterized protein TNCV_1850811 [Trichonephila clavipes]|nr:uncharacterized protein TNCV_1850811 [Trichonephila clavipes]
MVHDEAPAPFCAPVRDWSTPVTRSCMLVWFYGHHDLHISHRLIFFLWCHLEELLSRDVGTTQMDRVAHLHAACTSVDTKLLRRVHLFFPRRAQVCLYMHRGHFEHLYF